MADSNGETAPRRILSILSEAILVCVAGLVVALAANQLSPRGLNLARNYFPEATARANSTDSAAESQSGSVKSDITQTVSRDEQGRLDQLKARLKARGLGVVAGQEAMSLFRDPRYLQQLVVFVDARDQKHYSDGHIPGAWQFDRYYPEKQLPTVLPVCMSAETIVVYCAGGECEDSELAAQNLKEAG